MRLRILLFIAILSLAALPASAQGILTGSFGGWTGTVQPGLAPPFIGNGDKASSILADQEAAIRQEYGFISGEEGAYAQGADTIRVRVYRMKDVSGAYGLYTYLRTPEMVRADLAEHSAVSRERVLVLIANLILEVSGKDLPKTKADLKTLVASVTAHAEQGIPPSLWQRLPVKEVEHYTDRYFLGPAALNQFLPLAPGDWLGFSQGAEAELAKYRSRGHEITLLIADFPTPQVAQKKLAELQQKINLNTSDSGAGSSALYGKRSLTLVAIVAGAQSQSEATTLLNQVSSSAEITWNEPNFEITQPNIGTVILGAIFGTGIICAFALVSGIAFGGLRLVVKRFFPGRVFDRSSQMQVLQLGLSSKPINAEDFYGLGNTPSK
jgi:hypothetical protein